MNTHKLATRSSPYRAAGFSLIEMMISITLGMLIVAALVGVLISNSRTAKTTDRSTELQSNGRYALDHLQRELRHAGYRGYTWSEPSTPITAITPINNECLSAGAAAGSFVTNLRQGIWGANDSNPYSGNCLNTGYVRGDVLVLRHAANSPLTTNTINGTFYFRSSYAVGEIFKGTGAAPLAGAPTLTGSPAPQADFQLQEYVYYIGSDDNDATIPALRRRALVGSSMADEMVASGIEQMQVQYGRLDTALNTRYFNANAIVGTSSDTLFTATSYAWDEVNSARVWLLARTAKTENDYSDTRSYAMGDITYGPMNDNFRRQLFTAVIQLRN
ncbi:MAG: PilW family protein [Gallionella sp.]|nr:PilW family protein [Gallionella sp.]